MLIYVSSSTSITKFYNSLPVIYIERLVVATNAIIFSLSVFVSKLLFVKILTYKCNYSGKSISSLYL